jgi:hypothetical protein
MAFIFHKILQKIILQYYLTFLQDKNQGLAFLGKSEIQWPKRRYGSFVSLHQ